MARAYFYGADGKPLPVGTVLIIPEYAQVLRAIAKDGSKALARRPRGPGHCGQGAQPPHQPGRARLRKTWHATSPKSVLRCAMTGICLPTPKA